MRLIWNFQRGGASLPWGTYGYFQLVVIYLCTSNVLFLSILQKLGHRLSALNNTNWSEQTKDEIKQVLTVDYTCTSSDESSYEPDSDYEVPQLQNYRVKHLK